MSGYLSITLNNLNTSSQYFGVNHLEGLLKLLLVGELHEGETFWLVVVVAGYQDLVQVHTLEQILNY